MRQENHVLSRQDLAPLAQVLGLTRVAIVDVPWRSEANARRKTGVRHIAQWIQSWRPEAEVTACDKHFGWSLTLGIP